jgi:phytoene/squalene synthetase
VTIAACAALVERGDPDRFLAVMAAPVPARARLFPLYAFNLEVARAPWVTKEPLIAEMRLQWWRDVVAEDRPRAHEVAGPLHTLIGEANLPVAVLDRLIAARRRDVHPEPFEDAGEVADYLEDTAAGMMWLAVRALGAGPDCEAAARDIGWAAGLAGYLRAVPDLRPRGRVPLPDTEDAAIAALARQGLARLAAGRRGVGRMPRAARPATLAAWQAGGLLGQIAADPGRVAEGAVGLSEFRRRGGLLWASLRGRI